MAESFEEIDEENKDIELLDESTENDELDKGLAEIEEGIIDNAAHNKATESDSLPDEEPIEPANNDIGGNSEQQTDNSKSKPISDKFREKNAGRVVDWANGLQKAVAEFAYDWRTAKHYERAQADLKFLTDKVVAEGALSKEERVVMAYAIKYIETYEQQKAEYEASTSFDEQEMTELKSYAVDYMKEYNINISPFMALAMIIGKKIGANAVGALMPPTPYNPPLTEK
jgi:hypothetical protein